MFFVFAVICATFAFLMWFVFLRPAITKTAQGTIISKVFKPAGQYVQYPSPTSGAFYTASVIPLAECYVFIIQADQLQASVGFSVNTLAARQFEIGQQVTIEYQERGLRGIWRRVYVIRMLE